MISQVRAGVTNWYHYIHTGLTNVSHLTNSTGAVVRRYEFDAFGNVTYQSGSTTNNYRFQTKELHAKSNLVYFGARWYNPAIGRWTTPDPAGIIDGPNLYIYLNNNPINDIDAWGLCGGVGDFLGNLWKGITDSVSKAWKWWEKQVVFDKGKAEQIAGELLRKFPSEHNDIGDAKRHAEWSKRMADEINQLTSFLAGLGHEIEGFFNRSTEMSVSQYIKESRMDLHNNREGRDASSQHRDISVDNLVTGLNQNRSPY